MDGLSRRNPIGYDERILAFVDILGFADLVEASERDIGQITRIYDLLEGTKSMAQLPVGHRFKYLQVELAEFRSHTFSDTVTMSCPFESPDYYNAIIAWVMWYQYFMWAEEGVFLRGAVVLGKVFDQEDSSVVFGPAMVAAYRLEKKTAKWPRILVDSSIVKRLPDDKRQRALQEHLRRDSAGNCYLDYLRDLFALTCRDKGQRSKGPSDPISLFQQHKTAVEKAVQRIRKADYAVDRIGKSQERRLHKYIRLAKYHNDVVDRLCRVASKLQNNQNLVRRIYTEVMTHGLVKELGWQKWVNTEPEFTAENLKYVDLMPLLGIASDRVIDEHGDSESIAANDPTKLVDLLSSECPKHLGELQEALRRTKVGIEEQASAIGGLRGSLKHGGTSGQ